MLGTTEQSPHSVKDATRRGDEMTLGLLREQHELRLLAMTWLDKHWEELPEDLPEGWVEELTAELEAAVEDRAREWLEKKP